MVAIENGTTINEVLNTLENCRHTTTEIILEVANGSIRAK